MKLEDELTSESYIKLGAFIEGKLIAASLFFFDKTCMYYWIHVNSDLGRKYQAGYLLLDEAFKIAISRNIRWGDLGSSHKTSISRPKEYWGAKSVPCKIFERGG